jgi:hypothetical protein
MNIFKNNKFIIFCIYISCLFFYKNAVAKNNFQIHSIHNDLIYYNLVKYENSLYVSSNCGIYQINPFNNNLLIYDENTKGVINLNLTKSNVFKIKFINPPVILPSSFAKSVTDYAINQNYLYVISKGVLFIYKNTAFNFYPYNSVRSISENCVGTYSGVYINGNKLIKTQYTDGQIKEFDSLIFICFNGLTAFVNNKEEIIYWNDNSVSSSDSGKANYGKINDIYSIGNDNYLLISSKGIYLFNYLFNSFDLIYSNSKEIIPIRNLIKDRIKNNGEFHFIDGNKYFSLNTSNFKTSIIQDNLKYVTLDILECSFDGSYIYSITNDNLLLKYIKTDGGIKLMKTFKLETSYHSIIDNDDLIFIMGNNGLSVFEKSVERLHNNFILDEFNSNAIFKSKRDLSLGSIHGIYKFENVNSLEKKSYFENIEENQSSERYLFYIVLIFFLFIITIILIIKNLKVKNLSNEQIIIEIKKYVENNLSTVSMLSLQEEFKLDYYALNNLHVEFSPAKYIKLKRNIKAKELFQEKKDISKISKLTGYSESYLKKNKYLYLRL